MTMIKGVICPCTRQHATYLRTLRKRSNHEASTRVLTDGCDIEGTYDYTPMDKRKKLERINQESDNISLSQYTFEAATFSV